MRAWRPHGSRGTYVPQRGTVLRRWLTQKGKHSPLPSRFQFTQHLRTPSQARRPPILLACSWLFLYTWPILEVTKGLSLSSCVCFLGCCSKSGAQHSVASVSLQVWVGLKVGRRQDEPTSRS